MSLKVSLTREQMLTEMDQALADEIAKQSHLNNIHHTATDGKLVTDGNGQYIYTFTLEEPWDPQDDAPLRIAKAKEEVKCSVVNVRGTFITIVSDKPLSEDLLQRIDFIDDSTELLKRQREALKQVQEGEGRLASKSFGLVVYRTEMVSVERQLSRRITLREQQHLATSKALGGEVAFIVGPPGTGKTLTLAAIAFTHLREGRTVLIAAHTNIAIDNAMMKLCELCKEAGQDDLLAQGQVVRFGAVQKAELKNDNYQEVYLPMIVQRLNTQLQQEYDECMQALGVLKQHIGALSQRWQAQMQQRLQKLEHVKAQCEQLSRDLHSLEGQERQHQAMLREQQVQYRKEQQGYEHIWTETSQRLAQVKAFLVEQSNAHANAKRQEQELLPQLLHARAMNGIQRFFHGINLAKLEQQVGEVSYQAHQLLLSIQNAQNDESRFQEQMSTLEPRIKEYQEKLKHIDQQLHTPTEQAAKIAHVQAELTQAQQNYHQQNIWLEQAKQSQQQEMQAPSQQQQALEARLVVLDLQMRDLEKKIVENARVVGTTLTKTYMNQAVNSRGFDAVILDEVSMAPLPLIYLAATHANRSITFIGDPQQLAPIVMAETELGKKWLGNDLFTARGISLESSSQGARHSTLLNVQSRMHPQIARLANTLVYQNKIQNDFDTSKLKQISPLPDAPLVLYDTQDAAPTVSRPANGKSRRNYYHALCCLELAKKVLGELSDALQSSTPVIGIITPYAPQARLIQNLIKGARLQHAIQASTVHRFQGLEFDIVIFDTVESPGLMPGDFISGATGSNTMRLVNVAITRARQKLFIVAHQSHILQAFPDTAILKKVVQHAAHSATYSSLGVIGIPLATALQRASLQQIPREQVLSQVLNEEELLVLSPAKEIESEKISAYNEKTFYDALKQDLFMAHESITIASPFLASTRVNDLLPWLLEKQKQGVKITIYTKPLHECEAFHGKAAQTLLDAGLQLTYRPEMHQKAIILDGKTLYHGSLNVLSQYKSGESMLRLTKQPQLVEVLNEELQGLARTRQKVLTMTDDKIHRLKTISVSLRLLPALPSTCACGSRFVPRLRNDKSAAFYGCENYSRCKHRNIVNITIDHLQQIQILQSKSCTHCHNPLKFQLHDRPQFILFCCENECEEKLRIVFTR
jgi:hypothetical protein